MKFHIKYYLIILLLLLTSCATMIRDNEIKDCLNICFKPHYSYERTKCGCK